MFRTHFLPQTVGNVLAEVALTHLVEHFGQQHRVPALVVKRRARGSLNPVWLQQGAVVVAVIRLGLKAKRILVTLPKRNVAPHLKHFLHLQTRTFAFREPGKVF